MEPIVIDVQTVLDILGAAVLWLSVGLFTRTLWRPGTWFRRWSWLVGPFYTVLFLWSLMDVLVDLANDSFNVPEGPGRKHEAERVNNVDSDNKAA